MMYLQAAVAPMLGLILSLAIHDPGHAAQSTRKCMAELRLCNSHCNGVYESKRALIACRDRCKDASYVCKAQLR